MPRARRPWPIRLALGLGTAALVLGALELGARTLPDEPAPPDAIGMVPHPTRAWAMAPGPGQGAGVDYEIGADGLRAPAGDGPRVLTLGDSSVFGYGVREGDTLHAHLAAYLGAQVWCGAVPGYSTLQSEVFLDEQGWDLAPRLLVIANLWSDNNLDEFRDQDVLDALQSPAVRAESALAHAALFRQLRLHINGRRGLPQRWKVSWPTPDDAGVRRVPMDQYGAALQRILAQAQERQIGVVILTLSNTTIAARGLEPEASWTPYFTAQARIAEAWQVPRIDGTRLLGPDDFVDRMHPNGSGHAKLALGVAAALDAWPEVPVPVEPVARPDLPHAADVGPKDPTLLQRSMLQGQP